MRRKGFLAFTAAGAMTLTLAAAAPAAAGTEAATAATAGPDGFATVAGYGLTTTTGGAGGTTVTVSTTEAFLDYIARPGAYVIQVSGSITLPTGDSDGMYNVTSDKTIVGVGASAALVGGGLNIGLPVQDGVTEP